MTRAEWGMLYERVGGFVGAALARQWAGGAPADADQIARRAQQVIVNPPAGTLYRDYQTMARRALRAAEVAREMRSNPTVAPARLDVPFDRGIYASQSTYRYRVIVSDPGQSRGGAGGYPIVFGSDSRLTLEEVVRRARNEWAQVPALDPRRYDEGLRTNPGGVQLSVTLISIGRYETLD